MRSGRLADAVENKDLEDYYYDSVDDVCYEKSVMSPSFPTADQALIFDGYVDVLISALPTGYVIKAHGAMDIQVGNPNDATIRLSMVGTYPISISSPEHKAFAVSLTVVDNRGTNTPVTESEIKAKRDELEERTIAVIVDGVSQTFDADVLSLNRMSEQIRRFDSLPTLVGGEIKWGLSDGSTINVTKLELQTAYDDLLDAKADRRDDLHDRARTVIALPAPSLADIEDGAW